MGRLQEQDMTLVDYRKALWKPGTDWCFCLKCGNKYNYWVRKNKTRCLANSCNGILNTTPIMPTILPSNLTRRYVLTLCARGENKDFIITSVTRDATKVQDMQMGWHFHIWLHRKGRDMVINSLDSVGLTIEQAVRGALGKFGVTFKS